MAGVTNTVGVHLEKKRDLVQCWRNECIGKADPFCYVCRWFLRLVDWINRFPAQRASRRSENKGNETDHGAGW